MSEPESQADQPKPSEQRADSGSVFGNLPKQRPGSRSPRRAQSADGAAKAKPKAKTVAKKRPAPVKRNAAKPTSRRSAPPTPAKVEDLPPPPPREQPLRHQGPEPIGGIEDLAWAGVTVAAQAATVGVKLASRALEAVRKSVERP